MWSKVSLLLCSALFLVACGSEKDSQPTLALTEAPQVQVPADAFVESYSCDYFREFTENGSSDVRFSYYQETGTVYSWNENGMSYSYEIEAEDHFRTLASFYSVELDAQNRFTRIVQTDWEKENGAWVKQERTIERTSVLENGKRVITSNKVNGVETPYYWQNTTENRGKETIITSKHSNPSVLNKNGRSYSKYEVICSYTEKN